jgi:hypothetical protein
LVDTLEGAPLSSGRTSAMRVMVGGLGTTPSELETSPLAGVHDVAYAFVAVGLCINLGSRQRARRYIERSK